MNRVQKAGLSFALVALCAGIAVAAASGDRVNSPLKVASSSAGGEVLFEQGLSPNASIQTDSAGDLTLSSPQQLELSAGSTVSANVSIIGVQGTVANPSYSFSGFSNTGMLLGAANTVSLAANGVDKLDVSTTQITAREGVTVSSGGLAVSSGGLAVSAGGESVVGGLAVGGGETISSGGETISSGGLTVTGGSQFNNGLAILGSALTASSGAIISSGGLSVTGATSLLSTGGNVPHQCGIQTAPADALFSEVTCSGGAQIVTGGGCKTTSGSVPIADNYPVASNRWHCDCDSACGTITAYAICCDQ